LVLAPWSDVVGWARTARWWRSMSIVGAVVVLDASGVLHAAGVWVGRGGYAALTVHIAVAVVLAVGVIAWAFASRSRRRATAGPRPPLGRRDVLRFGIGTAGALAARGALEGAISVSGLDGADRRFTGSFEVASFQPEEMPITNWLTDTSPEVDVDQWNLIVGSGANQSRWTYAELLGAAEDLEATIDCTGGWCSTQRWSGVRLDTLLAGMAGRSIEVRSLTGYSRLYPAGDAHHLLLAVRVGGSALSRGHGFPARLVAPGRRGFWWVKWVSQIRVTDRPWWLQSPFPLQ